MYVAAEMSHEDAVLEHLNNAYGKTILSLPVKDTGTTNCTTTNANVNEMKCNHNVNNKFMERRGTRVSSALGCRLLYCANRNVFNRAPIVATWADRFSCYCWQQLSRFLDFSHVH